VFNFSDSESTRWVAISELKGFSKTDEVREVNVDLRSRTLQLKA